MGLILWLRERKAQQFGFFHLVALGSIGVALISALTSGARDVSFQKGGSLFLLFLYASTGVRLALAGHEKVPLVTRGGSRPMYILIACGFRARAVDGFLQKPREFRGIVTTKPRGRRFP